MTQTAEPSLTLPARALADTESDAGISANDTAGNVFQSDDWRFFHTRDPKARFDALRYILLPRLFTVLNQAIALVRDIYEIDPLADSAVCFAPNPRTRRDSDIDYFYDLISAGLAGKRTKQKWLAVQRKNGDPVQILPYRFEFILDENGLCFQLTNYWLKGMSLPSYRANFDFLLANENQIHNLLNFAHACPMFDWPDAGGPLSDGEELFARLIQHKRPHYDFASVAWIKYPISVQETWQAIIDFAVMFPIYYAYLEMAMGREPSFGQMCPRLNTWALRNPSGPSYRKATSLDVPAGAAAVDQQIATVLESMANEHVRVVPSVRWQVFQRDGFKCVACGKSARDGTVLQVDHIVPKSKGGLDAFDNYQTLCRECNIGKSNRSDENLLHETTLEAD